MDVFAAGWRQKTEHALLRDSPRLSENLFGGICLQFSPFEGDMGAAIKMTPDEQSRVFIDTAKKLGAEDSAAFDRAMRDIATPKKTKKSR